MFSIPGMKAKKKRGTSSPSAIRPRRRKQPTSRTANHGKHESLANHRFTPRTSMRVIPPAVGDNGDRLPCRRLKLARGPHNPPPLRRPTENLNSPWPACHLPHQKNTNTHMQRKKIEKKSAREKPRETTSPARAHPPQNKEYERQKGGGGNSSKQKHARAGIDARACFPQRSGGSNRLSPQSPATSHSLALHSQLHLTYLFQTTTPRL